LVYQIIIKFNSLSGSHRQQKKQITWCKYKV